MNMKRASWQPYLQVVLLAIALLGSPVLAQSQPVEVVEVGELGAISDAPVYIAQERGYFREQNIDVKFTRFDALARMVPFLATGRLDAGLGAISAGLFNAIAEGNDLRIVAEKGAHTPGHGYTHLVVRKDLIGTIRTLKDLRGRTVAMAAPDSINAVQLDLMLRTEGMSLGDLKLVRLSFPDMNAAFANRAIEAAMQAEPLSTLGREQGLFVLFKRIDEYLPNFNGGVLLYGPEFWRTRPDTARKFMIAYIRAVRDFYDAIVGGIGGKGHAEIVAVMTKYTRVKDASLYDRMVLPGINPNGFVDKKSIAQAQDWWAARGLVMRKVDIDNVVDYRWLEAALKVLGRR